MLGWFAHPGFLAGAALVALPIAIHLLNRFRYRRVRWAAFDFLVESERKTRRRVLLEQWALLLARCLAILAIVVLLARPIADAGWIGALGTAHDHLIALDDSPSMGQRLGEAIVFDKVPIAVSRLVERLAQASGQQRLTLVRTSDAATAWDEWNSQPIDPLTAAKVGDRVATLRPSDLSASPSKAIEFAHNRFEASSPEPRHFYLISDFRRRDWRAEGEVIKNLRALAQKNVSLHLVDVAPKGEANVAVSLVSTRPRVIAKGIPFVVEVSVLNHSDQEGRQASVSVSLDGKSVSTATIERVPPRRTASATIEIRIDAPGAHELVASVEPDALAADNRFFFVAEARPSRPALIVDGGPSKAEGKLLALALAPGGTELTGIDPRVIGPETLTPESLRGQDILFLVRVRRWDPSLEQALKKFVEAGGGVFIAPSVLPSNEAAGQPLAFAGQSLFDVRLKRTAPRGTEENPATLEGVGSPLVRVLQGDRRANLNVVRISRSWELDDPADPIAAPSPERKPNPSGAGEPSNVTSRTILARSSDGAPLGLERKVSRGRAILWLTSIGPEWINWSRDPSFVIALQELYGHLSEPADPVPPIWVGEPWIERLSAREYRRDSSPPSSGSPRKLVAATSPTSAPVAEEFAVEFLPRKVAGIQRGELTRAQGDKVVIARAFNVDPQEGDLAKVTVAELTERLRDIPFDYHQVDDLSSRTENDRGDSTRLMLLGLVLLLLGEQWLAYRLSYHRA